MYTPNLDKMVEGIYGPGLPPLNEIESRAAITLVNTNPAFDYLAPLPENVVAVGGLQVRDSKPLPKVKECFSFLLNKIRFIGWILCCRILKNSLCQLKRAPCSSRSAQLFEPAP